MIIDSHIHLPSLGNPQKWDYLLEEADKNGINLMILSHLGDWSEYPAENIVRSANNAAKAFADYAGGRVLWLAYLNPQLKNWQEELKKCIRSGACGIKLWISVKDSSGSLENTIAVLQAAARYKVPVLLHTYDRTDRNSAGEITIREFAELAQRCPDCVMIAAHAGGNWRSALGILNKCGSNVYADICGGYPDYEMVTTLCRTEGAGRLLFGSDALGRSFASQTAKVIFADIDEDAKSRIFWKNAKKVYNIKNIPALNGFRKKNPEKNELPDLTEEYFCFCGIWPFWESPCKTPKTLNRILAANNIRKAYAANLSSLFRQDLLWANRKFLSAVRGLNRIMPLAVFDPQAGNWRQLVADAANREFTGGLVSPYLHGWRLNDPAFEEFFQLCAGKKLKLWVNCELADQRFRHAAFMTRPPTVAELGAFMKNAPANKYVFQGVSQKNISVLLERFNNDERFFFEFSRLTDMQTGMRNVLSRFGGKRLVAGSEFPFRHIKQTRYTIWKLQEKREDIKKIECASFTSYNN
ncbi:MAG: amidohydrolase family protein [Victivallaceae bacterium]|nr:amidohydrolase family protein [Victivallaceae bacterium]